jgi:hypothetical protein
MASIIPVKLTPVVLALLALIVGVWVGFAFGRYANSRREGFTTEGLTGVPTCSKCNKSAGKCGCKGMARLICPPCRAPDMSKYVLKSSVPPCQACPDMSMYMLKTECPPVADLSKYVLKSSIPKQQPVIIDNSACKKEAGECPPCPRPRCPTVTCPPAPACPAPAPCARTVCPTTTVKCKAEPSGDSGTVRPFMLPLNMATFGM